MGLLDLGWSRPTSPCTWENGSVPVLFHTGTVSPWDPLGLPYVPSSIVFIHDNDPKHKSAFTQGWLQDHNIHVLPWAPSSPDMNIIEHAWEHVDRRIRARNPLPSNSEELWNMLVEEWARLDRSYIRQLYRSIPHRIQTLKEAKGGYTKY